MSDVRYFLLPNGRLGIFDPETKRPTVAVPVEADEIRATVKAARNGA